MTQVQEAEPPSSLRYPLFMVGQDSHGNWVVQDQSGIRGGLFVDRIEALRFVRSENGNHPHGFVMVDGVFELDMSRAGGGTARRQLSANVQIEAERSQSSRGWIWQNKATRQSGLASEKSPGTIQLRFGRTKPTGGPS